MNSTGLFGFLLALALPLCATEAFANVHGTMMVVKGDVKVTSAKTKQTTPGKVGTKVYPGDTITSGPDSRAKIIMSDKNVINVSPESRITIAKYENDGKNSRNVDLKVDYGKVRATVEQKYDGEKNKFNIRTPTAVAGVRGTDFLTGFNPKTQSTTIITFSGVVAVGKPGPGGQIVNPVMVKPGEATNVHRDQAPEPPKQAPREELQQMNMESQADSGPAETPSSQQQAQSGDSESKEPSDKPTEKQAEKSADKQADKQAPPEKQAQDKQASGDQQAKKEGNSSAPANREPAAAPPAPTMIDSRDLDANLSSTINVNPVSEVPKPPIMPPPAPTPPPVQQPNPFIREAGQKASAIIRVQ